MLKHLVRIITVICLFTVAVAGAAFANDFPTRPVKIIVPFNAGGETDITARLLAAEMEKILGQNVVVQNIAGASGMTGCKAMLRAKNDGYVLGVIPSGPLAMHPHMRKIPYSYKDFTYIGRVINSPYLVYVNKTAPWNSMDEMIADMKANPNKFYWGSSGVGSVPFFALTDLFKAYDVKARHVPFKGDTGAFQAMAGDRIHVYATTAGPLSKFDVKALSLLSAERSPLLKDLPPISEQGKDVHYSQWMVLVGPDNLPKNVQDTISAAMEKACNSPSFKEALSRLSLAPAYIPSEATRTFVQSEYERNGVNIKAAMSQ